jgi:hypothetical protein
MMGWAMGESSHPASDPGTGQYPPGTEGYQPAEADPASNPGTDEYESDTEEYPPDTPKDVESFPRRGRISSA